jgi:hypothetical protein
MPALVPPTSLKRLLAGAVIAAAASIGLSEAIHYSDPHAPWWWFIINGLLLGITSQPIPGVTE